MMKASMQRRRDVLLALGVLMVGLWLALMPGIILGQDVYHSLRLYGYDSQGSGDLTARDPVTNAVPEDPPYTDPIAVFNPQSDQAPRRDSLTWNPIWMSEAETMDENGAQGLYSGINTADINASEKVWFRMWYEPEHWDKDLNANGELDRDADGNPIIDEWYPAIMQEFTYLLMEGRPLSQDPLPTYGPVGKTSFVFPIGVREADLNDPAGYGLTSLDADFDGLSDIVHVESEVTLYNTTGIAADFDGDGQLDPLDLDGNVLSGDELVVLKLDGLSIPVDGRVQFLEHYVELKGVFDSSVLIDIWYNGGLVPRKLDSLVLYVGDMALAGVQGPAQVIQAVQNGGTGTNMCDFPRGAFFVQLMSVDTLENSAHLMPGRALGATHSAMEDGPGVQDRRPGDPWFLKRFYVDGHEYNVVAIKTAGSGPIFTDANCDLDDDDDGVLDDYPPPADTSQFQFVTVRTPIPKVPVTIEQHSVALQDYPVPEPGRESAALSVMPPYNYEHFIILDVQSSWSHQKIGPLVGPVPPILQDNGPIPYVGYGGTYNDPAEMHLFYLYEDRYDPFLGKLRERYAAGVPNGQQQEREFWYVRQWFTLPWEYTELVLPDISGVNDLYLVTSGFYAPQGEYNLYPGGAGPTTGGRLKFWFDPSTSNNLYLKHADDPSQGWMRLYGRDSQGPGDPTVTDPMSSTYPVEVLPYTDPRAPFDPLSSQAPAKDILTLNPAYMNEFNHGGEPISSLYGQIAVEGNDAREKVFPRMWYEPQYLDKILYPDIEEYIFPALMQEFTYMFLDTQDQPTHGQPGRSRFLFPMATGADGLPKPECCNGGFYLPSDKLPSFGYGLTTFDANFDGTPETVIVHSEQSLYWETGIGADFDGDASRDGLDTDGVQLSGDELVIFSVDVVIPKGGSAQFLDHLVTLENVAGGLWGPTADLEFWYTGGSISPWGGDYSIHPYRISAALPSLQVGDMVIANKSTVRRIAAGSNNLGSVDGGWFAHVLAISTAPGNEGAFLTIGRALGATHSAIDNGSGQHDNLPGDPWYLKRFFVDGHEYNVVAVKTVPNETPGTGEDYEFKYITIRTPVPKPDDFVNYQDSVVLQGYLQGTVFGVDTSLASVMPPFNVSHTLAVDIIPIPQEEFASPPDPAADCQISTLPGQGPLQIELVGEGIEPRFFGELKEKYYNDDWAVEQFHIYPDQYTQMRLLQCQRVLITTDWASDLSRLHYFGCDPEFDTQNELNGLNPDIPATNVDGYFQADPSNRVRVEFWYDPCSTDPDDPYGNDEPHIPTVVKLSGFSSAGGPDGLVYGGLLGIVGLLMITLGWRLWNG